MNAQPVHKIEPFAEATAHIDILSEADFQQAAMRCARGDFIVTDVVPLDPDCPSTCVGACKIGWRWLIIWPEQNHSPS